MIEMKVLIHIPRLNYEINKEKAKTMINERLEMLPRNIIDGTLSPAECNEDAPIILGSERPEFLLDFASAMKTRTREGAETLIDFYRNILDPKMRRDLLNAETQFEFESLGKACLRLVGDVNGQSGLALIDSDGCIKAWPTNDDMKNLQKAPEKWVLCSILFDV